VFLMGMQIAVLPQGLWPLEAGGAGELFGGLGFGQKTGPDRFFIGFDE